MGRAALESATRRHRRAFFLFIRSAIHALRCYLSIGSSGSRLGAMHTAVALPGKAGEHNGDHPGCALRRHVFHASRAAGRGHSP
jgi:hypothetical protein